MSYIDSSRGLHPGRGRKDVRLLRCPANILGDGAFSSFADRGAPRSESIITKLAGGKLTTISHSFRSLYPPLAALPSLPVAGPVIVYGVSANRLVYWITILYYCGDPCPWAALR